MVAVEIVVIAIILALGFLFHGEVLVRTALGFVLLEVHDWLFLLLKIGLMQFIESSNLIVSFELLEKLDFSFMACLPPEFLGRADIYGPPHLLISNSARGPGHAQRCWLEVLQPKTALPFRGFPRSLGELLLRLGSALARVLSHLPPRVDEAAAHHPRHARVDHLHHLDGVALAHLPLIPYAKRPISVLGALLHHQLHASLELLVFVALHEVLPTLVDCVLLVLKCRRGLLVVAVAAFVAIWHGIEDLDVLIQVLIINKVEGCGVRQGRPCSLVGYAGRHVDQCVSLRDLSDLIDYIAVDGRGEAYLREDSVLSRHLGHCCGPRVVFHLSLLLILSLSDVFSDLAC